MDGSTAPQTAHEALAQAQAAAKPHSEVVFQVSEATLRPPKPTYWDIAGICIPLLASVFTGLAALAALCSARTAQKTLQLLRKEYQDRKQADSPWLVIQSISGYQSDTYQRTNQCKPSFFIKNIKGIELSNINACIYVFDKRWLYRESSRISQSVNIFNKHEIQIDLHEFKIDLDPGVSTRDRMFAFFAYECIDIYGNYSNSGRVIEFGYDPGTKQYTINNITPGNKNNIISSIKNRIQKDYKENPVQGIIDHGSWIPLLEIVNKLAGH
jgi:hypothetical protein